MQSLYLLRTGANGDCCRANFHRVARSIITFKPGKTPVCVHLHRVHYEQARRHAGWAACPSVVIMDGQSVKTTERGGARGFDTHKRVKGRKRHLLVDTLGLLVANRVEPADTSDRRAVALLLGGLSALFPRIRTCHSRCRPRKPQARSNPEATPRIAATNRQKATTSVQDHRSDLDRGT